MELWRNSRPENTVLWTLWIVGGRRGVPQRGDRAVLSRFPPMKTIATIPAAAVIILSNLLVIPPEVIAQTEESLEAEFKQQRDRLSTLPEFSGSDADSRFRLAEELGHRGDMRGAIDNYREVIRLKPNWAEPYRGLGQVLLDYHDYEGSVSALRECIELGSDDHLAYYWLGRGLMGTGELSEAELAFKQASERKPDDAETFADLGLVLMAQGNGTGAEEALTRAIELKPDNADSHRLRDQLRKVRGDREQTRQVGLQNLHDLFGRE